MSEYKDGEVWHPEVYRQARKWSNALLREFGFKLRYPEVESAAALKPEQRSNGKWSIGGMLKIPAVLHLVRKDGSPPTDKDLANAKISGPGFVGARAARLRHPRRGASRARRLPRSAARAAASRSARASARCSHTSRNSSAAKSRPAPSKLPKPCIGTK